jgi:hypothetical protein
MFKVHFFRSVKVIIITLHVMYELPQVVINTAALWCVDLM